jgi:hypothetical protein
MEKERVKTFYPEDSQNLLDFIWLDIGLSDQEKTFLFYQHNSVRVCLKKFEESKEENVRKWLTDFLTHENTEKDLGVFQTTEEALDWLSIRKKDITGTDMLDQELLPLRALHLDNLKYGDDEVEKGTLKVDLSF